MRFLLVFSAAFLSVPVLASEPECFNDADAYMTATYGSAYRNDENLIVREERYGSQTFIAAFDVTSGTNYPVNLFVTMPGRGLCKVLSTPPIATLTAQKFDNNGYPVQFKAKDQGAVSHEITYTIEKANGTFKPSKCTEISWVSDKKRTKRVSCIGVADHE